jgi:hypothetical protein
MPPLDPFTVPLGTCLKCGLRGDHKDVLRDCIPALRDRIAELEFRKSGPREPVERARKFPVRLPNPAAKAG